MIFKTRHLLLTLLQVSIAVMSLAQPYLDLKNPIIDKKIIIEATVAEVWDAWTTSKGLQAFLAPTSEIELFPGGKYELHYQQHAPEGERGTEGCKVLSYIPNEMFSFTWKAPPNHPEFKDLAYLTWVVLDFKQVSKSEMELRVRQLGWEIGKEWFDLYNYFDESWDAVLEWLKESLENQ